MCNPTPPGQTHATAEESGRVRLVGPMPSGLGEEEARQILGVRAGANKRQLAMVRNRLALKHHPDRGGDTRVAQRINDAYALLVGLAPPPPTRPAEDPPTGRGGERDRTRSEIERYIFDTGEEDADDVEDDGEPEAEAPPPPPGPTEGRVPPDRPPEGRGGRGRARSEAGHEENEGDEEDAEDAEDDASNSETEAEAPPPAGLGASKPKSKKRKRRSGGSQRAMKSARLAPERNKGGFIDRGRRVFRDNQGALATGTKRSCLPDGLWMALQQAGCEVDLEDVRSIMPKDENEDTPFAAAQDYVAKFGFELTRVSSEMQKRKGGFAYNLLRETGLFLVQLRVTSGKDDPLPPDLHIALYDGKCVRDNQWYTKVKMIEDSDRTVAGARLVFDSLCKDLEVRINNIYELRRA